LRTFVQQKVYSYLTNHSARGSVGVKVKPQTVKHRIYGHDVWVHENPEDFERALARYKANNPDITLNVGQRRSVTINLFRELPEDEQSKYRKMASDRLKAMRALQMLAGPDRTE
jgi:hypothetical protein